MESATKKKIFTKHEANDALAFVEHIAKDVVVKWEKILKGDDRKRKENLGAVQVKSSYRDLSETQLLIEDIQYHTMELAMVGCFFKDFNKGVVLFPSERNGERGYFQWKVGEPAVGEFFIPQKLQTA